MRNWIYLALALGALLAASLLIVTRNWLLLPVAALAAILPCVLTGWLLARGKIREQLTTPASRTWTDGLPSGLDVGADLDAELQGLGYRPAGVLRQEPGVDLAVYIHESLPIYAYVDRPDDAGAAGRFMVRQLDTFWEGGGRLITSAEPQAGYFSGAVNTEGTRLTQLRVGGTATALDGQHAGTVRAWMAGRRQPLLTTGEALACYLEEDRDRVRAALERRGWLPFVSYLRLLVGAPEGVLKF
jgi:hypothetical protein